MESIISFIIGAIILLVVVKIFSWPIRILIRLLINGLLGYVLLNLLNYFGQSINISIPVNGVSSLIAGVFGIPGVIFLIIYYKFL